MNCTELARAVEKFASLTHSLEDAGLERPWTWQDYDEGVRFAFFRTYEELRTLAARLGTLRITVGPQVTTTQRILSQYHAAYRDMQVSVLGVNDALARQEPPGEWSLRTTLAHIIQAERSFFAIVSFTLDRARQGELAPAEMNEEVWDAFWAGDPFRHLHENAPFSALMDYYAGLHARVLETFATAGDEELATPSVFWESQAMPVEFRLHRFDSHLRQHTIQMEKILVLLDLDPSESHRLLRLIYAALAEVEGIMLGSLKLGEEKCRAAAEAIARRADEIAAARAI